VTIHPGGIASIAESLTRVQAARLMIAHWLLIGTFGALTWPWLLRSLGGGGAASRARLLGLIDLADEALPSLGSWRADAGLLTIIARHIAEARPRTIVEFGGGLTTLVAARAQQRAGGGRLLSFDAEDQFAAATRALLTEHALEGEVRTAPLVPAPGGWPGRWYAHGPLPETIDMLIVDGPPWSVHPRGRGAAATLFDRLSPGGVVILDDAARPGERLVARQWRQERPDFDFRFVPGPAGTLIGTRRG
jgi:predicted O-methyltransferase YrrM